MWYLKHLKSSDCYYILQSTECVVGRKDAQILIQNDPSISRHHCVMTVNHPVENMGNPEKCSVLKVKDCSKYGTFLNFVRLEKDVDVVLNKGDLLKFGQFESEFRVCYEPLIITTSCIAEPKKADIRKAVHGMCGFLVSEWRPSCTHVVMSEVKVTVKALCCLVSLKPITTPKYFTDLLKSYENKTAIPDPNNYIPPIDEPLVDKDKASFGVVEARKTLFKDKIFVFLDNNQLKKLELAVTAAGGRTVLFTEENPIDTTLITKPNYCVIQPFQAPNSNGSNFSVFVKRVSALLRRGKKRMIPEPDIGLAVVYCSTEKFCNPDFDVGSALLGQSKIPSQTLSQQEVYAVDTEQGTPRAKKPRLEHPSPKQVAVSKFSSPRPSSSTSSGKGSPAGVSETNSKKRPFEKESASSVQVPETAQPEKRMKLEDEPDQSEVAVLEAEVSAGSAQCVSIKVETGTTSAYSRNTSPRIRTVDDVPSQTIAASSDFTIKTTAKAPSDSTIHRNVQPRRPLPEMSFARSIAPDLLPNGFRPVPKNIDANAEQRPDQDDAEELPRNLMKISITSLVKRSEPLHMQHEDNKAKTLNVKNFKKFKKVACKKSSEKITRFEACNCHQSIQEIDDVPQRAHVSATPDEPGDFDWDSQVRQTKVR